MDISVIIPAYNEENRLGETLESVCTYLQAKPYQKEVLIINDGSTDNTEILIKGFCNKYPFVKLLNNSKNTGKAFSVNRGMLEADGELILFMDADGSTPIQELEKLKSAIDDGYDIAIGSRRVLGANVIEDQSLPRLFLGWVFRHIVSFILPLNIIDTQNGFKLFKKEVAKIVFKKQRTFGWSFDVEILYIATRLGYKIMEVPIVWHNDRESKVKLLGKIKMLFEIIKIRFFV